MNYVHCHVFLDSCAFDPKDLKEERAIQELFKMRDEEKITLFIAHSTEKEIKHPNTPGKVKRDSLKMIYTVQVNLTSEEEEKLKKIEKILAGDGRVENIKSDASHLFECQKYGWIFVTLDNRVLKKKDQIRKFLNVNIYRPSKLLSILNRNQI